MGDYLKKFGQRDDLAAPQVAYNAILKQGNTKCRLVFEQEQGTWYLVGVINDQWTI